MHAKGVVVAVLGEPRFGPGMVWPTWTGFRFAGCRMTEPSSVAVLILEEAAANILIRDGVGDERAMWVELPANYMSGVGQLPRARGTLVLGVYGPHAGYSEQSRVFFGRSGSEKSLSSAIEKSTENGTS